MNQAELKTLLEYQPNTGDFFWKVSPAKYIPVGAKAGYQKDGYVQIRYNKKLYYAHRLAFLYMSGVLPTGQVDHVNGLRGDNRWENLRLVSCTENRRNAARSKNNTSGVTGVVWDRKKNKWMARIVVARKDHFLGYFDTVAAAAAARKAADITHNFHPNHGRNQ